MISKGMHAERIWNFLLDSSPFSSYTTSEAVQSAMKQEDEISGSLHESVLPSFPGFQRTNVSADAVYSQEYSLA